MAISENRLAFIAASHGIAVQEGLCADRTLAEKPQTPREAIAWLAQCDPTCDDRDKPGRYLTWLAQCYAREWKKAQKSGHDHAMLFEDFGRIKDYLADFDAKKHKLPAEKRDLHKLDYEGLKDTVIGLRGRAQDIAATPEIMAQSTVLYNGPEGIAVVPHSTDASNYWGQQTQWCTAATESNNAFQNYNRDGALVILRTDRGEKYQGHRESALMNAQDTRVEEYPPDLQALLDALPDAVHTLLKPQSRQEEPTVDYMALLKENPALGSDRDFILKAVRQNGWALEYADQTLKADREIVLEAVRRNGGALKYADETLKADRDFILKAVRQNECALCYADETLRADREIVQEAVRQNGWALEYADQSRKTDREIVLEAVRQDGWILKYVDETLKADRDFMLKAVRQNGAALYYADKTLKEDPAFVLQAVKMNIGVLDVINPALKKEIPLAARQEGFWNGLETDWRTISYLDDVGLSLSPVQELEIFERGMADSANKLEAYHLHLFPSLHKDGMFTGATLEDAHRHLQERVACNPAAARTNHPPLACGVRAQS